MANEVGQPAALCASVPGVRPDQRPDAREAALRVLAALRAAVAAARASEPQTGEGVSRRYSGAQVARPHGFAAPIIQCAYCFPDDAKNQAPHRNLIAIKEVCEEEAKLNCTACVTNLLQSCCTEQQKKSGNCLKSRGSIGS